jgi:WD40 repeat protein
VVTSKAMITLQGTGRSAESVAFSADGKKAAASEDKTIKVWTLRTDK